MSGSVPPICSVFTAEGIAILLALQKCPTSSRIIIFTDSLSVLTALNSATDSPQGIIHQIIVSMEELPPSCQSVDIAWVPGHSGILGNEIADALAKAALSRPRIYDRFTIEDTYQSIKRIHQLSRQSAFKHSKYYTDFLHLSQNKNELLPLSSRHQDVTFSRIRTRSYPTKSKLFRFGLAPDNKCNCGSISDIDHIILECPLFDQQRTTLKILLGPGALSFSYLMETTDKRKLQYLIHYLKSIRIL
ncbi:uncharacterized protein [Parasteatoda tepidariorum]|uniref:uncharacterized protein n=1 Tax=Parasteatoda tepidariorum TaxID=114398 RepID=UPI0039BCFD0D